MALFASKSDPARAQRDLEAQIKAKADQRVDNAVRLQTAETKLGEARSVVERLALDADDGKLDAALAHKRACEDKVTALQTAGTKIAAEHAQVEAQLAKLIDAQTRAATAAQIAVLIETWTEQEAEFVAAAKALEATSRDIALIVLDAHGTSAFLMAAKTELPPAGKVIVEGLRQYAARVVAGHERAMLPQAAPEPPKLAVVPSEPMMTIFAMRNLKFTNQAGIVVCIGKHRRHSVPEALGREAIETRLALPISERATIERLEHGSVSFVPTEESCQWLGPPGKEAPPKFMRPGGPVVHSSLTVFTPLDRGPAFTITVPRGPEPMPMAASRSAADDEE